MEKIYQIAIDGPAGSGKSTIAKALAKELGIDYIDTGAMYRAFGYKIREKGIDMHNPAELGALLDSTDIDFDHGKTLLDGEDVSGLIRTPEVSMLASDCSAIAEVRQKLVKLQQAMGETKSVVMDGRDIGTVVFPNAQYKFFLTASSEERARRRFAELTAKGEKTTFEEVLEDMVKRDTQDTTRKVTPLRKADDALEVDTTSMNIEQVTDFILSRIKNA
ncbi:MAG: (d)CMP kinase [Firmicutes bacterium]|nr:(d)CMP kinase [Bacillota bacterium]